MRYCFYNGPVFDGEQFCQDCCVVVDGGKIVSVGPQATGPDADQLIDLQGQMLVPGFVDLQVNGGAGVLFNDQPDVAALRSIFAAHRRFGTTSMLPTLISDRFDVMISAVGAIADAWSADEPGILGLHLEGPYLSQAKRGVHNAAVLREPDPEFSKLLASLPSDAAVLLTVAPERVTGEWIAQQVALGHVVAIGHSDATFEQVGMALVSGVTGFTHLYNAMSQLNSRAPGVVGAALLSDHSWCGVIADGFHVHAAALKVALRAKPAGSVFLVTDAVHTVGSEQSELELCGQPIFRAEGRVTTADGTLAGSDLTMNQAVRNAVSWLGVSLEEALRMASLYPAAALGADNRIGRIAAGYQADLLVLDEGLNVRQSWVKGAGQRYDCGAS